MTVYEIVRTAGDAPRGDEWLSGSERALLAKLRVPKRRADWRLGRWTAKCGIAALTGAGAADIEVRAGPSGAPEAFLRGHPAGVALSISHCEGVGFCTLAGIGAALGCDVERAAPRHPAFLADYFTAAEQEFVAAQFPEARDLAATLLWSAKESALKALGCGLRADTRSVEVEVSEWRPPGGGWARLRAGAFEGRWRAEGDFVWTVVASPGPLTSAFQKRSITVECLR